MADSIHDKGPGESVLSWLQTIHCPQDGSKVNAQMYHEVVHLCGSAQIICFEVPKTIKEQLRTFKNKKLYDQIFMVIPNPEIYIPSFKCCKFFATSQIVTSLLHNFTSCSPIPMYKYWYKLYFYTLTNPVGHEITTVFSDQLSWILVDVCETNTQGTDTPQMKHNFHQTHDNNR